MKMLGFVTGRRWPGVGAAVAAVAAVALPSAPGAAADPLSDLHVFHDRTSDFVAVQDPAAFTVGIDKKLVVSPYGTSRTIECMGDGHYVAEYCRQFDTGGREHGLFRIDNPIRVVHLYDPF